MTKNEALYTFFSGFGLDAYPTKAPEDVVFPYLVYENVIGCAGDDPVSVTASIWYHTDSEKTPNAKAEEIAEKIGRGGIQIPCDDGMIWIKRGAPWCTAQSDQNDPQINVRILNLEINYM